MYLSFSVAEQYSHVRKPTWFIVHLRVGVVYGFSVSAVVNKAALSTWIQPWYVSAILGEPLGVGQLLGGVIFNFPGSFPVWLDYFIFLPAA